MFHLTIVCVKVNYRKKSMRLIVTMISKETFSSVGVFMGWEILLVVTCIINSRLIAMGNNIRNASANKIVSELAKLELTNTIQMDIDFTLFSNGRKS